MRPMKPLARILVAKDYDDARDMYSEMLKLAGYEVVPAKNGQEALDILGKERFDLVILDVALPKVDGITLIRHLRAQPRTQFLPIITISALVGNWMHKRILAAGADVVLDKPCLPAELADAVRGLLMRGPPPRGGRLV